MIAALVMAAALAVGADAGMAAALVSARAGIRQNARVLYRAKRQDLAALAAGEAC